MVPEPPGGILRDAIPPEWLLRMRAAGNLKQAPSPPERTGACRVHLPKHSVVIAAGGALSVTQC